MRSMSKFILTCVTAAMLTPNTFTTAAEIDYLGKFNNLTGNSFSSDYYLTREDFCVSVSKIFVENHDGNAGLPFEDAGQLTEDSIYYLSALYRNGILSGVEEDGHLYMRPEAAITRQEAIALLGRILIKASESKMNFSDSHLVQPYAYGYIAWFAENGIIIGYPDGSLGPGNRMTANELAILTVKTLNYTEAGHTNIETVFGVGSRGHVDGDLQRATFTLPYGLISEAGRKITVFDTYNNAIRTISSGAVETLTGGMSYLDDNGFSQGLYLDGGIDSALLNRPADGVFNSKGELFFTDSANHVIRHIKGNTVYTFSGTEAGFADGSRTTAKFNYPMAIAIDKNNNIYVADTLNNCIRKIDTNGKAVTIAGTPTTEGYKDGAANSALFRAPAGIAVNSDGSIIYVADTGNHMIRKIEKGSVTTIAGKIINTDDGDPLGGFANGTSAEAQFNLPRGIIEVDGFLLIADSGNNMIRAITKVGNVVTIAGNGDPGDLDGSCMKAVLNAPSGLSYYGGELYIADTGNNKIKKMAFDSNMYEGGK